MITPPASLVMTRTPSTTCWNVPGWFPVVRTPFCMAFSTTVGVKPRLCIWSSAWPVKFRPPIVAGHSSPEAKSAAPRVCLPAWMRVRRRQPRHHLPLRHGVTPTRVQRYRCDFLGAFADLQRVRARRSAVPHTQNPRRVFLSALARAQMRSSLRTASRRRTRAPRTHARGG